MRTRKSRTENGTRLQANEDIQDMLAALDRLSALQRNVVVLRYIQQEPEEAIARHTGRPPHQVRAIRHKAMLALRRMLIGQRCPVKESHHVADS